jgi:hypothetical protein
LQNIFNGTIIPRFAKNVKEKRVGVSGRDDGVVRVSAEMKIFDDKTREKSYHAGKI